MRAWQTIRERWTRRGAGGSASTPEPGLGRWMEDLQALRCPAPDGQGVAHQVWRVVEWPAGAAGDRLALAAQPLRADAWPIVRWAWRITPSPMALDGSLARKIRRLELAVAALGASETGPRRDEWVALQGLLALRDALVFQGEQLVQVDAVCCITSTPEWIAEDAALLRARLQALGIQVAPLEAEQWPAALRAWGAGPLFADEAPPTWARWLGLGGAPLWAPRVMPADRAAALVWPGRGQIGDPPDGAVYVGHTPDRQPVFVDFRQAEAGVAANVLAIGASGSGKSFWLKTLARGLLADGWWVVVLDVDGEYRALCEAEGGAWIDVSGERLGAFPDPLALPAPLGDPDEDARRWDRMVGTVSRLAAILGRLDETGQGAVERAVQAAWGARGVRPEDPASWDRVEGGSPTVAEIWAALDAARGRDPAAGAAADALWRFVHGSGRHLFQGRPTAWHEPPARCTVWHLGPLAQMTPGQTISTEAAGRYALILDATWEWLRRLRRAGEWTAVVVDEGQRVLPQPVLGEAVAAMATTIRKWNGILVFATNTPDPLWQTPAGQGLWSVTPIKALLQLEAAQVQGLVRALAVPEPIREALPHLPEQTVLARLPGGAWAELVALVPPAEAALYQTRGQAAERG